MCLKDRYDEIKFDYDQYQTNMTMHLRQAYDIVKEKLVENAIKMKVAFNQKIKSHLTFNKGDEVLMFKPRLNKITLRLGFLFGLVLSL
jgi:hypothetical protein